MSRRLQSLIVLVTAAALAGGPIGGPIHSLVVEDHQDAIPGEPDVRSPS